MSLCRADGQSDSSVSTFGRAGLASRTLNCTYTLKSQLNYLQDVYVFIKEATNIASPCADKR
eukprot:1186793-Prorocentrum_minimum.AAC.2